VTEKISATFIYIYAVKQEVGRGVFATESIRAGTFLLEYAGVRAIGVDPDDLFSVSHRQQEYVLECDAENGSVSTTFVDARLYGNESRFINYFRGIGAEANVGDEQVGDHVTQTDIARGDQLLLDYVRAHTCAHMIRRPHKHART
jgi:SET domain-containing protein